MIWVLAGTGDSFDIIVKLKEKYKGIIATVVTEYGQQRLANSDVKVVRKRLKQNEMETLIKNYHIDLIIDATHPFAVNVSKNVIQASKDMSINYIRYEREEIDITNYPSKYIIPVHGYKDAVARAGQFKRIFLTIGSKNLYYFTEGIEDWEERLVVRILPDGKFIKRVRNMGFTPNNLLAMQGPFSRKLNRVLLEEYEADVIVSKASGITGGLDTKIEAALDIEIPVIIIKRPELNYPVVYNDIDKLVNHCRDSKEAVWGRS